MMFEFRCCYIFLLVNVLTRLESGAGIIQKFVCPGDSVQAFQNVKFDSCNAVVSLYINGNRNALIATWSMPNCILNSTLLPEYKGKVILDENGTIWIHNIHPWDQAKYIVICPMDTSPVISEVQINVMAAPAKNCRPNIMQLGSSLIATLKANDCGKPVATLYWKDYGGVSNRSEPVLKLTPGKESGTYYACIEGPALTCTTNSTPLDYCSTFIIGGNNSPPVSSETWDVKTAVFIVVGIVLGILFILIAVIIIRKRHRIENYIRKRLNSWLNRISARFSCRHGRQEPSYQDQHATEVHIDIEEPENLNREQIKSLLKNPQSCTKPLENLSGEQTIPLEEIPQLWTKHFDNLKWKDIKPLLNDDQQQGLQTYCDNLKTCEKLQNADQQQVLGPNRDELKTEKSINDDQQQVLGPYSDPKHEIEEANTEHQPSTNSETMRELQELRDAALCKICFVNKMSTFFMPCNHIATCASCSISLQQCPVCRALIMEKLNVDFGST